MGVYSQMNVRIEPDVKARGDEVFAAMGLSPSQVVRCVWKYAAEHGEAPSIVVQALEKPPSAAYDLDRSYRERVADRAHNLVANYREKLGLTAPDSLDEIDYREMREAAWEQRLGERGLA